MREVRLYGHLGKRFGRVHRYDVRTPAEAVRALAATLDGFRAYLIEHSRPGYRVLAGREPRSVDTLMHPADGVIKIVPVTAGAGSGIGQIIAGIALIVVGVMTGGFGAGLVLSSAWAAGGATFAGYLAGNIGVALVIGGISQMLSPQPKLTAAERPENLPSYAFDGPVNTVAQGNPVPICYGRMIVGSQIISAGMIAEEYAA